MILATDDYAENKGTLLSPSTMREFIFPALGDLFKEFKRIGFKVIKHTDGNIMSIINDLLECNIDCLDPIDPIAGMDLQKVKTDYGDRITLKGNVDCSTTLSFKTEKETIEETKKCLEIAMPGGGYILSSSNSIHSAVKPKNYTAMLDTLKKFGKY